MDAKIKVMFTRNTDPVREGAAFTAGETAELSFHSAHRWFRRGAAVDVTDKADEQPKQSAQATPEPAKAPATPEPARSNTRK